MSFVPPAEFGPFIKRFRESRGLSLKDVEDITGVSESTLDRWERGKTQAIRHRTLKAFAEKLFDLTVEELYHLNLSG